MAIFEVLKSDNILLSSIAKPADIIDDNIVQLLNDLEDTCRAVDGFSIAAPQIGVMKRAMVIIKNDEVLRIINPVINSTEGEQEFLEGCLSEDRDNKYYGGFVRRPRRITLTYLDEQGKSKLLEAEGLLAVMICHENDHLDGIMFTSKIDGELYTFNSREERKDFREKHPLRIICANKSLKKNDL